MKQPSTFSSPNPKPISTRPDSTEEVAPMTEKMKVLVVDDQEAVLEAMCDILEAVDLETWQSTNGMDGIEIFKEHLEEIGVVLLDMKMPGLSGPETFIQLRQIASGVPVILSSGFPPGQVMEELGYPDNVYFLSKPFQMDTLIDLVGQVLGVEL